MFFTTDQIIESTKIRILAPDGQTTFQDSDFIRFINEELQLKLVPDMITLREDYFLKTTLTPIVQNQQNYTMPERAIGNVLKDMYVIVNDSRFQVQRINPKIIPRTGLSSVYPYQFLIQADQVQIHPAPQATSGNLQMWYYERPNQLVLSADCGQITAIAEDTPIAGQTTYTVNADLTSYESLDFLSGKSPFQLWSINVVPVSSTTTTVVVTSEDVQNAGGQMLPQVGDWICNEQTANIPMIPQDFHPLLAEMTAARVVQALGHNDKLEAINNNIKEIRLNLLNTLANRVEQNAEAILNPFGIQKYTGYGWALGWPV